MASAFGMTIGRTDLIEIGSRMHPEPSEPNGDAFYAQDEIAAVFDGLGSSEEPNLASTEASLILADSWREIFDGKHEIPEIEDAMRELFKRIQTGLEEIKSEAKLLATTAVIGKIWRDTRSNIFITIGHAGDSRAYAWRGQPGKVDCLTVDHSILQNLLTVPREDIETRLRFQRDLDAATDAQVLINVFQNYQFDWPLQLLSRLVPKRNSIYRYLGYDHRSPGRDDNRPTIYTEQITPGDEYYFTTDGIHGTMSHEELAAILSIRTDMALKFRTILEFIGRNASYYNNPCRHYDDSTMAVLTP